MSKITDDVLEDIFDTAMEGGITYWCGFREGSFIDIIAGNAVTLTCSDDEEEFELTKDKLLAGIKMYLDETGDTELIFCHSSSRGSVFNTYHTISDKPSKSL